MATFSTTPWAWAQAIDLTSQDVNLNVLPTFHAGGLGLYAGPIFHAGGTLVVMRAFDPGEFLRLIEEWRVTVLLLVPSIYLMLAQYPDLDKHDLSSVRHWGSGGSSLPPSLVQQYAEKGIIIQQGFGMTETGPTVFIITKEDAVRKAGSVGKPVLHTDVCIMDREGNVLGPNQVGELCIRGGNVTTGYWNRPEATAEAIVDGWLHSGDAAMYDEEGFYYIVDRWKDMFISGGENVYPAEVENRDLPASRRGRGSRHRRAAPQVAGGGPGAGRAQGGPHADGGRDHRVLPGQAGPVQDSQIGGLCGCAAPHRGRQGAQTGVAGGVWRVGKWGIRKVGTVGDWVVWASW